LQIGESIETVKGYLKEFPDIQDLVKSLAQDSDSDEDDTPNGSCQSKLSSDSDSDEAPKRTRNPSEESSGSDDDEMIVHEDVKEKKSREKKKKKKKKKVKNPSDSGSDSDDEVLDYGDMVVHEPTETSPKPPEKPSKIESKEPSKKYSYLKPSKQLPNDDRKMTIDDDDGDGGEDEDNLFDDEIEDKPNAKATGSKVKATATSKVSPPQTSPTDYDEIELAGPDGTLIAKPLKPNVMMTVRPAGQKALIRPEDMAKLLSSQNGASSGSAPKLGWLDPKDDEDESWANEEEPADSQSSKDKKNLKKYKEDPEDEEEEDDDEWVVDNGEEDEKLRKKMIEAAKASLGGSDGPRKKFIPFDPKMPVGSTGKITWNSDDSSKSDEQFFSDIHAAPTSVAGNPLDKLRTQLNGSKPAKNPSDEDEDEGFDDETPEDKVPVRAKLQFDKDGSSRRSSLPNIKSEEELLRGVRSGNVNSEVLQKREVVNQVEEMIQKNETLRAQMQRQVQLMSQNLPCGEEQLRLSDEVQRNHLSIAAIKMNKQKVRRAHEEMQALIVHKRAVLEDRRRVLQSLLRVQKDTSERYRERLLSHAFGTITAAQVRPFVAATHVLTKLNLLCSVCVTQSHFSTLTHSLMVLVILAVLLMLALDGNTSRRPHFYT